MVKLPDATQQKQQAEPSAIGQSTMLRTGQTASRSLRQKLLPSVQPAGDQQPILLFCHGFHSDVRIPGKVFLARDWDPQGNLVRKIT